TVFVVVTLLVALGIAVAQGCQGPAHSMGELPQVPAVSHPGLPPLPPGAPDTLAPAAPDGS
ncbi:serine/threonine protein kinase, partial [Streptomyces sp. UNOC14_S4]|nr:serine/threonine protein kinase [Streptomyces sp. UNOC14_S4]